MKRSRPRTTPFLSSGLQQLYILLYVHSAFGAFTSQPRWGQAVAVLNDLLVVSGGKTDQYGSYSYTSAPTTNDLFTLDLSSGFDPMTPPWKYISGSQDASTVQGQQLAWHTLATFNATQLLLFGGDGGPNSPIVLPSESDSAQLLDVSSSNSPTWINVPEGWAGQPSRRIHHSTASVGGMVYLIGGEKDDGSSLGYSDHYVFDPGRPSFTRLPSNNSPPDIYGHGSVVLSDGRLLVFGGYSQTESTLVAFTTIWCLNTTSSSLSWSMESVASGSVPSGRRAFAYTWLEGDRVLIHGGSDADFQTSYSDGWMLDTSTSPMTWTSVGELSELGARRDHFAVQVGSQVLFGFGYGTNAGASVALSVFDVDGGTFTSSFSPQSGPSLTTLPVPSGTSGGSNGSGSGGTAGSNPTGGSHGTGTGSGDPSATGTGPNGGDDNGGGNDGGGGSGGVNGDDDGDKRHTAVIAIAAVFSVLVAAVTAAVLIVVVIRRRRTSRQFHLIHDDDDRPRPGGPPPWELAGIAILPWFRTRRALARGEKTRVADKKEGWTVLGLGRPRGRIDMLANEDASDIGFARGARRWGSGSSRSWYSVHDGSLGHERYRSGSSSRPSVGRLFNGSFNSLKSIGASVKRVVSGGSAQSHGRQWTDISLPLDGFDAYEDNEGLLLHESSPLYDEPRRLSAEEGDIALAARPRGGREGSSSASKYSDPFQDREEGEVLFDASRSAEHTSLDATPSLSNPSRGESELNYRSSQATLSHSSIVPQLPPLVTTASKSTSDHPSSSSLLDGSNAGHTSSSSSHQAALSIASSSTRPRTSSLIGSVGPPSSPVKRSDSWWARFKRSSLRENGSEQTRAGGRMAIEFRDPNPPPGRLGAIKEASGGSSGGAGDSPVSSQAGRSGQGFGHGKKRSGSGSGVGEGGRARIYEVNGNEQSTTSLKTSRTADSAALERLAGRVDVALREGTGTSIDCRSSVDETAEGSRRWRQGEGTWSSLGTGSDEVEPDRSQDIADSAAVFVDDERDEQKAVMQSPTEMTSPSDLPLQNREGMPTRHRPHSQSLPTLLSSTFVSTSTNTSATLLKGKSPISPGTVAARVADYEKRMSLEMTSSPSYTSSPSPLPSTATPTLGSSSSPTTPRTPTPKSPARRKAPNVNVKYGLVTRPSLFVANPDRDRDRHSLSGSSDT